MYNFARVDFTARCNHSRVLSIPARWIQPCLLVGLPQGKEPSGPGEKERAAAAHVAARAAATAASAAAAAANATALEKRTKAALERAKEEQRAQGPAVDKGSKAGSSAAATVTASALKENSAGAEATSATGAALPLEAACSSVCNQRSKPG